MTSAQNHLSIGSHIWSLMVPINRKSRPNVTLGQVGIGSTFAKKIVKPPGSHIWLLLVPSHMNSLPKVKLGTIGV